MVGLDYCIIGLVCKGKNTASIASFQMEKSVVVQNEMGVRGNTEVYCLAETSGYSLGFISDVPGLQRINGEIRREWTVRERTTSRGFGDCRRQRIGASGDAGAWLIRRSDNAVMGLIWGRNRDNCDFTAGTRLAYFTPVVDILDELGEGGEFFFQSSPAIFSGNLFNEFLVGKKAKN
ncbi:hypothetical protein QBC34DRAFT_129814 [Podospora aff. communis PSN243]|uniref:Uncharacterized protein n=1 Tax=Podospora aff. communis PSN243 TaxID=3040156 RepID=A0AAV9GIF8_9PEZI|nr:hypothetical protein QBC34DRAFT_129814 [Podospora aff. communis PSN243]